MILGLRKYGYYKEADEIKERVLRCVNGWFERTGCIYEFYDALDKTPPSMLKRKGDPIYPHDYKYHLHSVADFNWSACFTHLLINGVYLE